MFSRNVCYAAKLCGYQGCSWRVHSLSFSRSKYYQTALVLQEVIRAIFRFQLPPGWIKTSDNHRGAFRLPNSERLYSPSVIVSLCLFSIPCFSVSLSYKIVISLPRSFLQFLFSTLCVCQRERAGSCGHHAWMTLNKSRVQLSH